MSFLKYLDDKRLFISFYVVLMIFISLMIAAISRDNDAPNIVYVNIGGLFISAVYLAADYFRMYASLKTLRELSEDRGIESAALIPKVKSHEQELYYRFIKKLYHEHTKEVEKLFDEKLDYKDFIMAWIHEVKTPITAARLLIQNTDDKSAANIADLFENELDKIDRFVEQALYYSRIDSFSKDYLIQDVSLNRLVKETIKKYAKLFIERKITFSMWEGEVFVYSDPKWLSFIIGQIVANSLKYTNAGGTVSFDIQHKPNAICLVMRDTGIGISSEDIGRVFDKGFTGSTGRQQSKSTGMGLYLAKRLMLKLGHEIEIESKEKEFTQIIIRFLRSDR
ncbi:sensor histidine kinase [Paenibacillus harenae]|uniref:sensor histidine kinase n=1 Tax=Paenibacillus harenae TaxID=306543 RepID=UPI0003F79203|nr:sensor histidine kinase [Paenibacillus harenae]